MKLWSKSVIDTPLFSFDVNDDYVYDAKWHPTNASLFASVDGSGKLDFWDLNKDVEVPTFRYDMGKTVLNKIRWSQDGKRLAVGDFMGKVSVMQIEKELYSSKPEDSLKFEKMISIVKNNKKGY
jgi:dynein intermediate chain